MNFLIRISLILILIFFVVLTLFLVNETKKVDGSLIIKEGFLYSKDGRVTGDDVPSWLEVLKNTDKNHTVGASDKTLINRFEAIEKDVLGNLTTAGDRREIEDVLNKILDLVKLKIETLDFDVPKVVVDASSNDYEVIRKFIVLFNSEKIDFDIFKTIKGYLEADNLSRRKEIESNKLKKFEKVCNITLQNVSLKTTDRIAVDYQRILDIVYYTCFAVRETLRVTSFEDIIFISFYVEDVIPNKLNNYLDLDTLIEGLLEKTL